MAVFDPKSRYVKHATTYTARDRRGRSVAALTPAAPPVQAIVGEHRLKEDQRLDHLAGFYLQDANSFWRIAEANGAVLPDALAEVPTVKIPAQI